MLGIGATTAVFSVVDRILFRPLPYTDGGRLVSLGLSAPIEPKEFMLGGSYYDWQDQQRPFTAITSEIGVNPCDLTKGVPARLHCGGVEANFLATLGVRPVLGRDFAAEDDLPHAPRVGLLTYAAWKGRFGGDPAVLGRVLEVDNLPVQVVGVLPQSFEMPRLQPVDLLLTEQLDKAAQRRANPGRPMWAFARLKPGVSVEQARAQLQPVFELSLAQAPPFFRKEVHLVVRPLRDRQVHEMKTTAWVLLGMVLAVLLIACANVASLLVARGAVREREFAIRAALGASRMRLARQALLEAGMIALAGGAAGFALAAGLLRVFVAIAPAGMPFLEKAQLDLRILGFTFVLSLLCGAVFGLGPALARPNAQVLGNRQGGARGRAGLWQGLVIAQMAISLVLLASGALLCRSFWRLEDQRLGMQLENVVTANMVLGQKRYATHEKQMQFFEQLRQRLGYNPNVSLVAMSDTVPPGGHHHDQIYASLVVPGRPQLQGTGGDVAWRWVSPEYFKALEIPLLEGEGFTEEERTSKGRFVVLSKLLAARMWPGQSPLGQRMRVAGADVSDANPEYTVVGVAADVKNGGLAAEEEPEYYRLRRAESEDWDEGEVALLKTAMPQKAAEAWVRQQLSSLDPEVLVEVDTMQHTVSKLADEPRFQTVLVGSFAVMGLVLAVVGLYGVLAFLVAQRTQEIGVRMALGAARGDVLRLVMGRSLRLIAWGVGLGLAGGLGVAKLLTSLLFEVGPHDPFSFALVTVLLVGIAMLATLIPARRAAKVDPMVALRCE
jgi:putative ABC transport system permease protein